ncbi:helix-turn-helix transcriptional regulator [Ottowia sp.]|uniref:helix-turn-helix domain-containing protein n=1 Tax=Ottowia sp. TaxID=1898956 RepID=UPI002B7B05EF|nr:helix-turn-helix transcriptional regulator [Ottowia sp.]HRN77437.1 helix-turn-helix transcriptional regulator [Ottowia sp.]HRQ04057.1 helix-turn-helix transcriptional regulator [Ottowia sp.]
MNSLTTALKSEIARVARKELKGELLALRKTATAHRSEIAALKREIRALQSQLKANRRTLDKLPASAPAPASDEPAERKLRFSAEAFAAQRARLGLTQVQMARLLGASALSVYKWETGKVHPRAAQLERIAAVRKLGKREVAARLAEA